MGLCMCYHRLPTLDDIDGLVASVDGLGVALDLFIWHTHQPDIGNAGLSIARHFGGAVIARGGGGHPNAQEHIARVECPSI